MTVVYDIVLILHFIGLASLLGGFIVQMRSPIKGVNPAMLHGALTQLVTGLILAGLAVPVGETLNTAVVTIKLLVVLIITVLAFVGRTRSRRDAAQTPLWGIIGALTLLNVIIAVWPGVVQG